MPPKKSRAVSTRTKEPNKTYASISIQTEDIHNNEILNYQKQIALLQQEITIYKSQITELQSENNILKSQNNNAIINDVVKIGLLGRNALKVKNDKISSPRSGTKNIRGCSCKGNCSNKICGCVKKGISCQEFCRCNDAQCRNQEPEKENIEQAALTQDGQKALEKLGRLTLNQETLHASEKKAKRGMFSPFGDRNGIGNAEKVYSASPLTFETRRRLFTQDSDDIVDVSGNTDDGDSLATEPKRLDPEENVIKVDKSHAQLIQTPVAKRTRRLRNTEKNVEVAIVNNKIEQENEAIIHEQEEAKQEISSKNEHSQNPAILITNVNEGSDNEDVFLEPGTSTKVVHSPRVIRKKSKSVSPDQHVARRKYGGAKLAEKVKSRSVSPTEKASQPKLGRVQHSPQPLINYVRPVLTENNINIKEDHKEINSMQENQMKIEITIHANPNKTSVSFESDASDNSSSSNNNVLDMSLNPMVPKRQLPRSPINAAGSMIVPGDKKRFSPPKKELAVVEVDWEQHKSELVMCKICKRKFFPHRIEKHVPSCKGI